MIATFVTVMPLYVGGCCVAKQCGASIPVGRDPLPRIALALYMPNGPYYGFAMVSESPLGRATIGSTPNMNMMISPLESLNDEVYVRLLQEPTGTQ